MTDAKAQTGATTGAAKIDAKKVAIYATIAAAMVIVPLVFQTVTGLGFLVRILAIIGIWILLALGLNIVVGYAGLLDLGYIAFYAMGGYVGVLLGQLVSTKIGGATYWAMLIPAAMAGAATGLALGFPVLRLRGDYLAIVTLGFGEIVRILLNNDFLGLSNGASGLPKGNQVIVPPWPSVWLQDNIHFPTPIGEFVFGPNLFWYFVVLLLIIGAVVVIRRLDNSR